MRTLPRSLRPMLALLLLSAPAWPQATSRESLGAGGAQGDGRSILPAISADGRYVTFQSDAANLVAGDTNGVTDVFVRDRLTGTTERVSVDSAGAQGNGASSVPSISADGRYVAFLSNASNLVTGDTNGVTDVFVHDRTTGATERASVATGGAQSDGGCGYVAISPDGRFVAIGSVATNLVVGDTNGTGDVFLRDRIAGTTERVSVGATGQQGNNFSGSPAVSADGRFVAFSSVATNLVTGDTNNSFDVFVRDVAAGTTERVNVDSSGTQANFGGVYPSISADGRFVAFFSVASNLVVGDTNGFADTFLRDRASGTTERISVATNGAQGDQASSYGSISDDGRYVAFQSRASNLVPGDMNGSYDVFLRDRISGTTRRVSVATGGTEGNGDSGNYGLAISADGRCVTFDGRATNLVAGDTNAADDVFVWDLDGSGTAILCDPGAGGVIACPCSNPASGPGRGCDNSAATGGASLAAAGVARLAADSLSFTSSGEVSIASSFLFQGDAPATSGSVYGQGVRCAGGALRKLYSKRSAGGGITAPDLSAGEPSVSSRSAARGDPISAGGTRWYFVGYRDPVGIGGCTSASRFNATPTVLVVWGP